MWIVKKNIEFVSFKTDDYLKSYYPGKDVVNVAPDGSCMTRAVAFCLFKDDEHWALLSKAINEFIRENWPLIGGWLSFPMSLKLGVSGEIVVQNEDEYLKFLKRNEALYLWRDCWDLVALSELLQMRITVIRAKDEYIETVQKIEPISIKVNEDLFLFFYFIICIINKKYNEYIAPH